MTTINANLNDLLALLNLSENEVKIYLAGLELGASSIWEIAQKSGVKRPTCYVVLEELAFRGFASSHNDGRRVVYSVISPKQLMVREENRHRRLRDAESQLQAIASSSKEKPRIRTFLGAEGIEQVYNMALEEPRGSEFLILGENMLETDYVQNITESIIARNKKGIQTRGIFPDNHVNRTMRLEKNPIDQHNNRFLPVDSFAPQTQTLIFGRTVVYVVHTESEPFATVIESNSLAHDEKMKFELFWELAKE
jgi:sugar-specific transcriptional regulator TrmB